MPAEEVSLNFAKVKYEYQPAATESKEDSFDFTAEGGETNVSLIAPAVQDVSRETDGETGGEDSFDFTTEPDSQEVAMLLPAVQAAREAARRSDADADMSIAAKDDGGTAYEVKLDDLVITSYDTHGTADSDHDKWIDVLSIDWGTHQPSASDSGAGLRSDGELVQAVGDADMGGDFIL